MLYFSQTKQDPDKIDIEQLSKLREFKKKTFPNALIETYSDPTEFKGTLSRQLELQLRTLLAAEMGGASEDSAVPPVTDIVLHFADAESGKDIGTTLALEARFIEVTNFEDVPEYVPPEEKRNALAAALTAEAATAATTSPLYTRDPTRTTSASS